MRKIMQFYNDDDHRQVKKTLGQLDFRVNTDHDVAVAVNGAKITAPRVPAPPPVANC